LHERFFFLDGTRGLAALAILALHFLDTINYSFIFPNTNVAVDFFFMLSGFVIAAAYEARIQRGDISFRHFLVIRFIRLYPLYAFGMTVGLAVGILKMLMMPNIAGEEIATAYGLGLLLIPSNGWFGTVGLFPLNNPSWTLFFEIVFNIVFILTVPVLRTIWIAAFVALSAAALFWVGHLHGPLGGETLDEIHTGFARVSFGFGAGVLMWRMQVQTWFRLRPVWAWVLSAGLLLILMGPFDWNAGLLQPFLVVAVLPAIVALSACVKIPSKRGPWVCDALGRLSYPLYIVHYPFVIVFGSVARAQPSELRAALVVLAGVICVLLFAALLVPVDERFRALLSRQAWANRFRTHRPA